MPISRRTTLTGLAAIGGTLGGVLGAPAILRAQVKPVKIALITTLTGPAASLGAQQRDGFALGVKHAGGMLGGRPVEVSVLDDELKPDHALDLARTSVDREEVDFVVGPIFSNVLAALLKPAVSRGGFLISPNAGPSTLAGKGCNANLFVTAYCNDQVHSVLGAAADDFGYKRAFLMVPNYQAGRDAVAGFKSRFHGEVLEEVYVPLNQLDFSAELSRVAAAKPDVLYTFMPGGLGINLVKQFKLAGLTVPVLSSFTVDEASLPVQGDAALGWYSAAPWAPNMDNPVNKRFVADYDAEYKGLPATYAAQAYDAASLLAGALKQTGGDTTDKAKLRAALQAAPFESVRGPFRFGVNHYPVQDFYLLKVVKRPDGRLWTQTERRVLTQDVDPFASECHMAPA